MSYPSYSDLELEIQQLKEENKKLKSDLSECECSFWFENDEVWYRKRECKKLKEINESQNEEIQRFKDNAMQDMSKITDLKEENKKLKEKIKKLKNIWKIFDNCIALAFLCFLCSWILCIWFMMITDVIMWFQLVRYV